MADESWKNRSLVLGLGNPGAEYEGTRHNRGREVVEELARRRGLTLAPGECQTRLATDGEVVLATPETFMNRSGYSARCLVERFDVDPARLLVVYDDIYLPLGAMRLRTRGGPGGQKGMASILECLRTEAIARLRLGIALSDPKPKPGIALSDPKPKPGIGPHAAVESPPLSTTTGQSEPEAGADLNRPGFVLARFGPAEEAAAREQIVRAADACEVWLAAGAAEAMNRFNRDPAGIS